MGSPAEETPWARRTESQSHRSAIPLDGELRRHSDRIPQVHAGSLERASPTGAALGTQKKKKMKLTEAGLIPGQPVIDSCPPGSVCGPAPPPPTATANRTRRLAATSLSGGVALLPPFVSPPFPLGMDPADPGRRPSASVRRAREAARRWAEPDGRRKSGLCVC